MDYTFSNINDVLSYVNYMLGKDLLGKYISPQEFSQIFNEVQVELIDSMVQTFEENREMTSKLIPFVKTAGDNVNPPIYLDSYGKADFPADCVYHARGNYIQYLNDGCNAKAKYKQIVFLDQATFGGFMNMPMLNPLVNTKEVPPYMVIESGQMRIVPNIGTLSLTYIRYPIEIYYDYDIIGGEPVFLPAGQVHVNSTVQPQGSPSLTVNTEWGTDVLPTIANMIYQKASISIGSQPQ